MQKLPIDIEKDYVICMLLEIVGNQNLVEMPNIYSWFFFRPKYIEIMYLHHR